MKAIAKDGPRTLAVSDVWDGVDMSAMAVLQDSDIEGAWEVPIGVALSRGTWTPVDFVEFVSGFDVKPWKSDRVIPLSV